MHGDEPMIVSPTQQQEQGENVHKFVGNFPTHGAVVSPGQWTTKPDSVEGSNDQRQQYPPMGNREVAEDLQKNAPTAAFSDASEPDMGIKWVTTFTALATISNSHLFMLTNFMCRQCYRENASSSRCRGSR
jgi:hypothetical protein